MTAPAQVERPAADESTHDARPWVTIVWNDPVNLMSYVTYVLQDLFGYSRAKATELMLAVHHEGRAVVSNGSREQMEHDVARCHARGLWATLQQD
ncbi:MAG: clpS [Frankiales bacterium]|nr:clpS [Frankiales bacterium]